MMLKRSVKHPVWMTLSGEPVAFSNTSAVDICSCVYLIA